MSSSAAEIAALGIRVEPIYATEEEAAAVCMDLDALIRALRNRADELERVRLGVHQAAETVTRAREARAPLDVVRAAVTYVDAVTRDAYEQYNDTEPREAYGPAMDVDPAPTLGEAQDRARLTLGHIERVANDHSETPGAEALVSALRLIAETLATRIETDGTPEEIQHSQERAYDATLYLLGMGER